VALIVKVCASQMFVIAILMMILRLQDVFHVFFLYFPSFLKHKVKSEKKKKIISHWIVVQEVQHLIIMGNLVIAQKLTKIISIMVLSVNFGIQVCFQHQLVCFFFMKKILKILIIVNNECQDFTGMAETTCDQLQYVTDPSEKESGYLYYCCGDSECSKNKALQYKYELKSCGELSCSVSYNSGLCESDRCKKGVEFHCKPTINNFCESLDYTQCLNNYNNSCLWNQGACYSCIRIFFFC